MAPRSILLDAQALSALAADGAQMRDWAAYARAVAADLYVSAITLAETTDGTARDANVRRALKAMIDKAVTTDIGYRAGALRAKAATRRKPQDLTVDAAVAATALTLPMPVIVLTTDETDLMALLADTGVAVEKIN
jgi:predicted nucleic acid-binding protein